MRALRTIFFLFSPPPSLLLLLLLPRNPALRQDRHWPLLSHESQLLLRPRQHRAGKRHGVRGAEAAPPGPARDDGDAAGQQQVEREVSSFLLLLLLASAGGFHELGHALFQSFGAGPPARGHPGRKRLERQTVVVVAVLALAVPVFSLRGTTLSGAAPAAADAARATPSNGAQSPAPPFPLLPLPLLLLLLPSPWSGRGTTCKCLCLWEAPDSLPLLKKAIPPAPGIESSTAQVARRSAALKASSCSSNTRVTTRAWSGDTGNLFRRSSWEGGRCATQSLGSYGRKGSKAGGGGDFEGLGLRRLDLSGLDAAEAEALAASSSFLFCSLPSSSLDFKFEATRSTKDQPPSERRSGTTVVSIGHRALDSRARRDAAVMSGQIWSLAGNAEVDWGGLVLLALLRGVEVGSGGIGEESTIDFAFASAFSGRFSVLRPGALSPDEEE